MGDVVTAAQVERHFVRSHHTRALVNRWIRGHGDDGVVDAVRAHRSRVVNAVTLLEVQEVCEKTAHALGRVEKAKVESIRQIRDWSCPFAVSHVFHFITEAIGTIPTYQRFKAACSHPRFRHMLWTPAVQAVRERMKEGMAKDDAKAAMRWRIGNFYYSFLREQWVHAYLRSRGIVTRQHPLADALFAVDGWVEDKVISLYIGNARFRTARGGRKRTPQHLLRDARPPFSFVTMELAAASEHGTVHLPHPREVDAWADAHFRN